MNSLQKLQNSGERLPEKLQRTVGVHFSVDPERVRIDKDASLVWFRLDGISTAEFERLNLKCAGTNFHLAEWSDEAFTSQLLAALAKPCWSCGAYPFTKSHENPVVCAHCSLVWEDVRGYLAEKKPLPSEFSESKNDGTDAQI